MRFYKLDIPKGYADGEFRSNRKIGLTISSHADNVAV